MANFSRRVACICPVLLWSCSAEEASCSDDPVCEGLCEGGSCSSSLETPIDFVAMADDLDALNRSTSNKLHEIRRVPCTGDWYPPDEPVILEGCCWAVESAFRKGNKVADCSNDEDFLPLDYFNISLGFLLEHCGTEEFERPLETYAYEEYVKSFLEKPVEVQSSIDDALHDIFNITLMELNAIVQKTYTVAEYLAQMRNFEARKRPHHVLGYFHPFSHAQSRTLFECPALMEQLRETGFPMLNLHRPSPQNFASLRSRMKEWANSAAGIAPASSFTFPAHLHHADRTAKALLLLEGKKHWQLVPITAEVYSELEPIEGYTRKGGVFHKAPIDLADEHPVYVGTQLKGDVLITPWMWAHHIYSIEDSLSTVFSVGQVTD